MNLLDLTVEGWILVLRILLVLIVYLFLLGVLLAARREWRSAPVQQTSLGDNPRLIVINGGPNKMIMPGQAYPLEPVTSVGRSDGNTILLDDTFVSTQHASLALRDDGWWIEDLGSRNGTYVNRRQLPQGQAIPVRYGDEVQIGNVVMKLTR